jgi:integrase
MVAGHLQEKKGLYYIVLNFKDENGVRKSKWEATGLPIKGNKKKAEDLLVDARKAFEPIPQVSSDDILFADYMEQWLEIIKPSIELVTYSSYCNMVKVEIAPYFKKRKIKLNELQAKDIQDFYVDQLKRVKASTVIHYHANIHKALKYAVKMDMIPVNPADKVDRPKKQQFVGSFYDADEINQLFEVVKGSRIELAVMFGAFYGLRRSEVVGLKWDAIDFKSNNITICHTVTSFTLDGKRIEVAKDRTKTASSLRTLPLVPAFKERLLALKKQQEVNRALFKRSYCTKFLDYICVDEMGERIKPGYNDHISKRP